MLKFRDQKTRGGRKMRTKITLACTECKQRNYNTTKNKAVIINLSMSFLS